MYWVAGTQASRLKLLLPRAPSAPTAS